MRPVNKGDGSDWDPATTMSFAKHSGTTVRPVWTALNNLTGQGGSPVVLTVTEALQLWLDLKTGHKADPNKCGGTAIAAIQKKLNSDANMYKSAAGPLTNAIGAFCAYCETNITGLVEVDHQLNEANFPTYIMTWENFLPSCGPCNNTKSSKPSRADLAASPPPPVLDVNDNDDEPFFNKLGSNWAYWDWPDIFDSTYQDFPLDFQFSEDDGATWQSMSYYDAADVEDNWYADSNITTHQVWADLRHDGGLYYRVLVRVLVTPDGQNLVEMCGLNDPGSGVEGNPTYDRRTFNRTMAWIGAMDTLRPLLNCETAQDVLNIWGAIQQAAKNAGFWSVWATLLSQWTDLDEDDPQSLGYWLINSDNASQYYPGTNATNIILPDM